MNAQEIVRSVCDLIQAHPETSTIIQQNERDVVFSVDSVNDGRRLIKVALNDAEAVQLENEVDATQFLASVFSRAPEMNHGANVVIPRSNGAIYRSLGWSAISIAHVEAAWFADKMPALHLTRAWSAEDTQDVLRVMLALHALAADKIPQALLDRGLKRNSDADYVRRFTTYLEPVIAAGHVSAEEASALQKIVFGRPIVRAFVHHDIIPWNIGRQADGRLVLVDAEFARWGMALYDVAYFFLQTHIMLDDAALAQTSLSAFRSGFLEEGETRFDELIWVPLGYRLAANLNVALQHPEQMARAKALLQPVLQRDLDAMLAS